MLSIKLMKRTPLYAALDLHSRYSVLGSWIMRVKRKGVRVLQRPGRCLRGMCKGCEERTDQSI